MKKIHIVIAILALIAGGGGAYYYGFIDNPKNLIIPEEFDSMKPGALSRLSEQDKKLFAQYLTRKAASEIFGKKEPYRPITVGEAIETQKAFLATKLEEEGKKEALKKEVKTQIEAQTDEFNKAVTVTYIGKSLSKGDYRSFIEIKIAYQNNTPKDIAGIKGKYIFKDIFGDEILTLNSSMDKTLKAGVKYVESGSGLNYNQFREADNKFLNTPDEKMKFAFQPEIIIFTDGSKLEIPKPIED